MSDPTEPEPVDAEFEPAEDAARSQKPRKSGGIGGYFLTFLFAAIVGAGLGGWIAWTLDERGSDQTGLSELRSRLADIESSPGAVAFDPAELEARLTALESVPPPEPEPVDLSGVEARLEALEAVTPANSGDPDIARRFDALESAVAQNSALANQALDQLGESSGGLDPAVLTALETRLTALENAEPAGSAPVDLSAIESRLSALESSMPAEPFDAEPLVSRLDALETAAPVDLSALRERIDALETRQSEQQSQGVAGDISGRQLAARSLSLVALIESARSGQPFEAERAALARLWPNQPQLNLLSAHARSGVPDVELLVNAYPRQEIEDAIGTNRVFFGLIELRPSSGSEASPLARVVLAHERLDRNDLAGAVLLTEQLEGAPLEAAQSWLVQARARLAINTALDELRSALTEAAAETGADPL